MAERSVGKFVEKNLRLYKAHPTLDHHLFLPKLCVYYIIEILQYWVANMIVQLLNHCIEQWRALDTDYVVLF